MDPQISQQFNKLVKEAQKGSNAAFQAIFEALSDRLFIYAVSRVSSREDAMDLVQDTFIDLWKALNKFEYRSEEEFLGFVFKIAKRKLSSYYNHQSPVTLSLEESVIPEHYEIKINDYGVLLKHINCLAEHYQELIKLRYWSDLTFSEIASFLGINEVTAKVRHHRAIKKLQANLINYENIV